MKDIDLLQDKNSQLLDEVPEPAVTLIDSRHRAIQPVNMLEDYITILADFTDERDLSAIAKGMGISAEALQAQYLNNPEYLFRVNRAMQFIDDLSFPLIKKRLLQRAAKGDATVAMIKTALTALGRYAELQLSLQARMNIDREYDDVSLPSSPQGKQEYIAKILIETGFSPQKYEELWNEQYR